MFQLRTYRSKQWLYCEWNFPWEYELCVTIGISKTAAKKSLEWNGQIIKYELILQWSGKIQVQHHNTLTVIRITFGTITFKTLINFGKYEKQSIFGK